MLLFDSDILIDYLRFYPPALDFLAKSLKKDRAISFISQFELLQGCQHKDEKNMMDRFVRHFKVYPISASVSKTAWQIFQTQHFQIHLGIPDTFIAATALIYGCKLLTRNLKHYEKIPSLKVEKPYP